MPRHEAKGPQGQFRITQPIRSLQEDSAIHDRKFHVRQTRPKILELLIKRWPRRRKLVEKLQGNSMDRSRVTKIKAQPVSRAERLRMRRTNPIRSGLVLSHPRERVVVARVAKMEKAAERHQENERLIKLLPQRSGQQRFLIRPAPPLLHRGDQSEPAGQVVVPQASRPILHVRFEMKDCVSELVVTAAGEVGQTLDNDSKLSRHQLRNQPVVQPSEKTRIASEVAAIEQRDRKFYIVRIKSLALGKRSRRGAQFQPEVPHFLREIPDLVFETPLDGA